MIPPPLVHGDLTIYSSLVRATHTDVWIHTILFRKSVDAARNSDQLVDEVDRQRRKHSASRSRPQVQDADSAAAQNRFRRFQK